jgi:hypothetical protein
VHGAARRGFGRPDGWRQLKGRQAKALDDEPSITPEPLEQRLVLLELEPSLLALRPARRENASCGSRRLATKLIPARIAVSIRGRGVAGPACSAAVQPIRFHHG